MDTNLIFQFNNVSKPYFLIKYFDGEKLTNIDSINLKKYDMENNLPNLDEFAVELNKILEEKNVDRTNATFLLNCNEAYKITMVIPNVGDRKIKKIYDAELVNKLQKVETYDRVSMASDASNGNKIFYEFVVEKCYKEFFEKLGAQLAITNINVDYYYSYLYNHLKNIYADESLVYLYEEKNVTSLLVCINGILCGYSSFEPNEHNYRINIAAFVDNHASSLENVDITKIITNKKVSSLNVLDPEVVTYNIGE